MTLWFKTSMAIYYGSRPSYDNLTSVMLATVPLVTGLVTPLIAAMALSCWVSLLLMRLASVVMRNIVVVV